jgi:aspartyl protease family protein
MSHENPEHKEQKRMGMTMQALAWLIFIALGVGFFSDVIEKRFNPNPAPTTYIAEDGVREVVLKRNRAGHYVTAGAINGQPVVFMLDTGATGVALPAKIADQLGVRRGRAFPTQTANGISTSYATSLDSVSVGEITLSDVRAGITPGLNTEQVLLGMSFLKHIEFTQRGNTLILRQYPQGY